MYDSKQDDNLLSVDNQSLKIYLQEMKGFIFSGKFQTKLLSSQLVTGQENYGLVFNITLKHSNSSYANMQQR